jgi:hypothetical protein
VNGAVEMRSGALVHIPSLIKISSAIHKLIGWWKFTLTNRDCISLLYFFHNKERRLKIQHSEVLWSDSTKSKSYSQRVKRRA